MIFSWCAPPALRPPRRDAVLFGVAALVFGGLLTTAAAQEAPAPSSGGVAGLLETLHVKGKVAPAPDFVTRSRTGRGDFIPVGTQHPTRPVALKTPEQLAAETEALDAARVRQQRRAGQPAPAVPLKPAKAAKPAKVTVR